MRDFRPLCIHNRRVISLFISGINRLRRVTHGTGRSRRRLGRVICRLRAVIYRFRPVIHHFRRVITRICPVINQYCRVIHGFRLVICRFVGIYLFRRICKVEQV
jgi:hypothetical protein